jgi:ketosteroid isomerase-like protein
MAGGPHFSYLSLLLATGLAVGTICVTTVRRVSASATDDRKIVAALDTEYQAAVKVNDAAAMARILADDFVLVTGSGKTYTKVDMLNDARNGDTSYQHNDEDVQTVRVWGDTAVVTAKLWEKGTTNGKSFDRKFWFSDTYVRTPAGWKYVFGQSSLALPNGA